MINDQIQILSDEKQKLENIKSHYPKIMEYKKNKFQLFINYKNIIQKLYTEEERIKFPYFNDFINRYDQSLNCNKVVFSKKTKSDLINESPFS